MGAGPTAEKNYANLPRCHGAMSLRVAGDSWLTVRKAADPPTCIEK